jgi:hypothetical protein
VTYEERCALDDEFTAILTSLTPAGCSRAVDIIEMWAKDHDDETAHAREDQLHQAVLLVAAKGLPVAALATIALRTRDIKFARWCA